MRKNIIFAGLIILVIGAAMFGGGDYAISHSTTTGTSLSQIKSNPTEFVHNLSLSSTMLLTVESSYDAFFVISASNISNASPSNINTYKYTPIENTTVASINVKGYDLSAGNYCLVAFNSTQPSVTYSYLPVSMTYVSLVSGIGIFVFIIGIIVAIIGLVLKKKKVEPLDQI